MIRLVLDEKAERFEQDIRELVKAFYPGEEFEIHTPEGVHLSETTQEEKTALKAARESGQATEVNGKSLRRKAAEKLHRVLTPEGLQNEEEIRLSLEICGEKLPLTGERKQDKAVIKSSLYDTLSALEGRELPWGNLTGIRPVSIASALLEKAGITAEEQGAGADPADNPKENFKENFTEVPKEDPTEKQLSEIREFIRKQYRVQEEKLDLMMDIGLRERRLMRSVQEKSGYSYQEGWSLYVGIPFCPTRCLYCSFLSNTVEAWKNSLSAYLENIRRELRFTVEEMCRKRGRILQTVYIGGGTPTALPEKELETLMQLLHEECDFSHVVEFTVEAGRPDSINAEKLKILKKAGVTRISVNPQTFTQRTLDLIGRKHTVEEVEHAYRLAREAGFDNINMDIILGLPEERLPEVTDTLCHIAALKPESLTVHSLAVKRAARLNAEKALWSDVYRAGGDMTLHVEVLPDGRVLQCTEMERMMRVSSFTAERLGLKPYYLYRQKNMAGNLENVGYAAEGKECLYNILMMEEKHTVIGCGAGCSSKLVLPARHGQDTQKRVERCDNGKDIGTYIRDVEKFIDRKRELLQLIELH